MKKHIFYDLWCATYKVPNIKLEYDKTKKIKDQILFQHGHVKLLNVSKSYCEGEYQGVWFLFLVDTDFLKLFKSADMGFKESLVDDLNSLITHKVFNIVVKDINECIDYERSVTTKSFEFISNNKKVNCVKVYADNNYIFTNFHTDNIVQRGAYSKHPILSALNTGNFQCSGDDHDCIVGYYKNNSVPNLANTVTFNSTNYSSITYDNSI